MRNLIFLLVKYGGVIFFIILEIVCFSLIVNNNQKQKEIYDSTHQRFTGSFYNNWDRMTHWWGMSSVADSLAKENAELRGKLRNAQFISTILKDSAYNEASRQRYTFIHARIVSNSVKKNNNNLRISRGTDHGIAPHMGVIAAGGQGGIVGITTASSPSHTKVMSILNRNSRISVEIESNREFGSLAWRGNDYETMRLEDIPKDVVFSVGDTVQTSGFSSMFPQGIIVGTIDTSWVESGSNVHTIDIKLINDLRKLRYVYVVNDLLKEDIEIIEDELEDE